MNYYIKVKTGTKKEYFKIIKLFEKISKIKRDYLISYHPKSKIYILYVYSVISAEVTYSENDWSTTNPKHWIDPDKYKELRLQNNIKLYKHILL